MMISRKRQKTLFTTFLMSDVPTEQPVIVISFFREPYAVL